MSQNLDEEKSAVGFEMIASYERLIKLRRESPDKFLLQTGEATRAACAAYTAAQADWQHDDDSLQR